MNLDKETRKTLLYGNEVGREKAISEHVPYSRHVDDRTVRTKDGMLMQVLKIEGFCHDTADSSAIDQMAEYRNTFLRSLGDSRYAIYAHIIRREVKPEMPGEFENGFARLVNDRYMESLKSKKLYVNDLYMSVIRKGFHGKVGLADNVISLFRKGGGTSTDQLEKEALNELHQQVANFETEMKRIGARVLKIVKQVQIVRSGIEEFVSVDALDETETATLATDQNAGVKHVYRYRSEVVEFLAQLLNGGVPEPMLLPRMPLDEYIPTRRVTFGKREFELRGPSKGQTRFGAIIGVRELRDYTFAGMFDALLKIPGEFIATQSFALADRAEAMSHINLVSKQLESSDERGTALIETMRTARDEIVGGRAVNGLYHLTFMALGNSRREMEICVQQITKGVLNQGIVAVREDMTLEAAFWAQLPANFGYIARRGMISSANFVGMASFHNYAVGKRDGNHWGPAISLLLSKSQSPYFFNFHVRQLGNFTVVGPSGYGKTVGLAFLASQAMRVKPRLAFFDKDRGAEVFIRAMGGQYEVLQPGEHTGFNPLQVNDTKNDRDFVLKLIKLCVRPRDEGGLTAEQEQIVADAVSEIFKVEKSERRFDMVPELLRGRERAHADDLASRFEIWLGARGWLFNNPVDNWDPETGIIGFDMTKILDDTDVRSAALFYIFHRLEGLVDGIRPAMVIIDEGWKMLGDERFAAYLNDKLKTIRKLKGLVGFCTQSAKDVITGKHAHTLIEQTSVNIFFPNPKADVESYQRGRSDGEDVEGFKLSDAEFAWVKTALPESREFLIRTEHDSVIAKLDLSGMQDLIKVMSGTAEAVEECAALRARYGDQPDAWLPYFCGWKKEAA